MKNTLYRHFVLPGLLLFLLTGTSCDPVARISYEVTNASNHKIILINSNIATSTGNLAVTEVGSKQTVSLGSDVSIGSFSGRRLFNNNTSVDSLKFCYSDNITDTIFTRREDWKFRGLFQNKRAVLILE